MNRRTFAVTGLLLTVLLSGCFARNAPGVQDPPAKKVIVLGFAQSGSENDWRTYNTQSIRNASHSSGVQVMYTDAEQKQENQIKAIRSYIAYQADVISFSPIVEKGWDNVLEEAKKAGIPVLLVDGFIQTEDKGLYAGYIGSDFWEEGRKAARFLLDKFERTTDAVNIVELCGTEGSSMARGRSEGFREVLAAYPNFRVIHSESGDFMRSRGKEIMAQLLENKSHEIDVVFSHNDAMTLGAIESIEENGLRPGKDIVIISVDGEQKAIDALKAGKINCIVECTPDLGPSVMELTAKLSKGEPIPRETYLSETVYTEWDNLSELPTRLY